MDWALAIVALILIALAAVSKRLSGSPITPAILFVSIGILVGPKVLDGIDISSTSSTVRALAEATLALVLFSDASRIDFLRRCGLAHARALVVTTDDSDSAEHIVRVVRKERPDLTVVARARDARHAGKLYALGVTDAVPETVEASLQLSEAVLVDIGIPMGLVIASIHEKRDEYRKELSVAGATPATRALRSASRRFRPRRDTE